MKKTILMFIAVVFLLLISIFMGILIYNSAVSEISEEQVSEEGRNIMLQQVNSQEEKITPNTEFIIERHYKGCGHTTVDYVEIPSEIVNMTEKQIQELYSDYVVKKFNTEQVILKSEEEGNCDQHYVLRKKDGYIAVYWVNQDGNESLKELTGIAVEYLTENDKMEINEGIFVYGLQELNSKLEDYE